MQQHQQILEQEHAKFQAHSKLKQTQLKHWREIAADIKNQVGSFRNPLAKLRQETAANLQAFTADIACCTTQINNLAMKEDQNPDRIKELAKIEAFDLWMQSHPETDNQLSAETLLPESPQN